MNTLDKIVFGTTITMVGGGLLAVFLGALSAKHGNDAAVSSTVPFGIMSAYVGTYITTIYYDRIIKGRTKDSQNNSEAYAN